VLIATLQPSSTGKVDITITGGTPNASISGQLGYWDSDNSVWVNIPWDNSSDGLNFDENGNLTISDIEVPVNQESVQLQVTYYADWTTGIENTLDKSSLNISVLESGSTAVATSVTSTTSAPTTESVATSNTFNTANTSTSTTPYQPQNTVTVTSVTSTTQQSQSSTTTSVTYATPQSSTATSTTTTANNNNNNSTGSSNLKGDANCDNQVKANDLLLVKKHVLGIGDLSGQGFTNADVNGDGNVKANDLLLIKKFVLGIISSL
jgi:hypothetical protein